MSLRLLTCLLILSVGHGEEVHNIRGGTTKEKGGATGIENSDGVLDVDISSNTSKRQSGAFSLVDAKEEAITLDPDSHRKPKTLIEKEKMTNEAKASKNAKTVMKKDTTTSDEQQSSVHMTHARLDSIHQAAQTKAQPESTNSTSGNKGRMRGLTVETLHRRADGGVKTCEGLQKIVQCKDGVEEEVCKQDLVDAGVEVVSDMVNTTFFAICVDTQKEVDLVAELADVEGVEDDPPRTLSYVHGSEEVVRLLQNNRQVVPYGVDLVNAPDFWDRYGTKGGGVKVCVIDTGLRATHEDIKDLELSGSDGNNVISEWYEDGNSHGTHVTGTIAGVDNNIGVVGVAPEASIHVVRVFNDNGQFTASSLVVAMNACASANAKIISMSLGGPVDTFAERTAVRLLRNSGILLVAASGNDANGINLVEYPAGYDPVVSVGALDDEFQIAEFSTHNTEVDIAGPGVGVLSSTSNTDRSYAKLSGTSMATPHIAGVAALLWSRFPNSSVDEIREAMEQSARDIGACGKDRLFGNGVVDVVAAAEYLENGGNVAPELGGCIDVSVELKTDDWGQETTYIITPKQGGFFNNQDDDIVYRGGPYPNNRRSTYRDNIRLEDGCYNLVWRDSYGDGANNPEYGTGEIKLTYGGNKQVDFNNFADSREAFEFGNCDGGGPSPTQPPVPSPTPVPVASPTQAPVPSPTRAPVPSPTQAPVPSITQAPVPSPTQPPVTSPTQPPVDPPADDRCGAGESVLELFLETDRWSRSENHMYLFDSAAPQDEWIWIVERTQLRGNREYVGTACLVPTSCYKLYFFDEWGDGLASGAGLTLTLDGTETLRISPGDSGTLFEDGEATTYWYQEFGTCTSISSNNDRS